MPSRHLPSSMGLSIARMVLACRLDSADLPPHFVFFAVITLPRPACTAHGWDLATETAGPLCQDRCRVL